MSQALAHFALGAAGTTVVVSLLQGPLPFKRTLVLLGGVWAMVPDIYWIAPTYTEPIRAIHDTALANLFWFHRTFDVLDPHDTNIGAALAVGLWISLTITVEVVGTLRKLWMERTQETVSRPSQ